MFCDTACYHFLLLFTAQIGLKIGQPPVVNGVHEVDGAFVSRRDPSRFRFQASNHSMQVKFLSIEAVCPEAFMLQAWKLIQWFEIPKGFCLKRIIRVLKAFFLRPGHAPIPSRAVVLLMGLTVVSLAFGDEIHNAARRGDLGTIKALLKDHPELVLSKENNGATALHWAALLDHKEVAELLLVNQAEVDARDSGGETPLLWAAYMGHKDLVELLLANQASVNAKDRSGATPLHAAAQYGHTDVVALLLASKADVNAANHVGETPLHFAAAAGRGDVVALLRQHGGYDGSNVSQVAAEPFKQHSLKQDLDGIQGTWKLVALENNGHPAPAEFVVVMKLVFKGDTLAFPGGEPGFTNYKFKLDPTTKPAGFTRKGVNP